MTTAVNPHRPNTWTSQQTTAPRQRYANYTSNGGLRRITNETFAFVLTLLKNSSGILAENSPTDRLGPYPRGSSNSNSKPPQLSPIPGRFSIQDHSCRSYSSHMPLLIMSPPSYNPYPAGCSTAKINFVKSGESMVDNNSIGSGSCGREKLYMKIRSSLSPRQDESEIPVILNRAVLERECRRRG
jgi:hypothetical protein